MQSKKRLQDIAMKFKQYDNGNRFIVFDSSDSPFLQERVYNILFMSNRIESVVHNSPTSLKVTFLDVSLTKDAARTALNNILLPLAINQERTSEISKLEAENPLLEMFLRRLHGSNYSDFVVLKKHLIVSLYHFFLYDFICNFKDSDMLWCLPFFETGVFDVYGNFDAIKLLKEFEDFKQLTVASNE